MALQKQAIPVNFAQGLDTKTDPFQVQLGKFLTLTNSVFNAAGRLTKRSGYKNITTLPVDSQTTLTTLNDNLIATGADLYAYSADTNQWFDKGSILPISLETQALVRVSTSQDAIDSAVSANGLTCVTYIDSGTVYYQISDSATGQHVIDRVALTNAVSAPRVFVLGIYFVVTFISNISGIFHLQYITIPTATPNLPSTVHNISSSLTSMSAGYDGIVANNNLYLAWSDAGPEIKVTYLSSTLVLQSPTIIAGATADLLSVTADNTQAIPIIWVSYWDSVSMNITAAAFSAFLAPVLVPTTVTSSVNISALTSAAEDQLMTAFYEVINNYASPYPATVRTDYVSTNTITQLGLVSTPTVILRSVGLASKPIISNGTIYLLVAYGETNQPTYFLIDMAGNIYMRLAYSNGGGYVDQQVLPTISLRDGFYYVPYLIKDFLTTVNKGTNNPAGTPVNAVYTQTGVNMARFSINSSPQYSSEIASALHLTGGQLWMYDGVKPVEHGFQVWPENLQGTVTHSGGNITTQQYFYVFTYEWTDNQGNLHRSAPSIPLDVDVTSASNNTVTLYVPTLRLTYKTDPNPVRIVGYRWSAAQQIYYQFTSVTMPTLNDPTVDFVTITDTFSDAQILGNAILYTTGGVVENIAAPANTVSALYKNRLFIVDAEDRNLIWFSKQVIEAVPVEMSDLFTLYVAPTSGAQGSTGPITALSAIDDKLIIFKRDAIYYITGAGPDNTGANDDFSEPIYVTSSVGCTNPNSIVLMPQGLMFQSDKGIWLLGRDLSTTYIGAPVEQYNSSLVKSAQSIPATNQVRFVIDNSTTLMYDYYYGQWGTFSNINAISSTLYNATATYLNEFGQIFQETPGMYTDGSVPVLMSFTTSWVSLAGLQGFERLYFMFLLGVYYSPFKLNVQMAYDFNPNPQNNIMVTPDNFSPNWGDEAVWGSGQAWGGPGNDFRARLFPRIQKCESFQLSIYEQYDASLGVTPGQGLSLSGINLVIGAKKGYRTQRAAKSFG